MILGAVCCALAVSCENLDDAEYADDICLGAKLKTLDCEAQYGSCAFDVVSNRSFRVDIIEGSE